MPNINWVQPEEEREYARHITTQLHMLQFHEGNFRSALSLMDHIEAFWNEALAIQNPFEQLSERARRYAWLRIPIESAAFSVYHFRSTLCSIRDQLKHAPTLAKKVDSKAIQDAYDRFHAEFPEWKLIRDFIGHFADKMFSPGALDAMRGERGPVMHGGVSGRRMTFTNAGEYVHFDATAETLERLRSVKQDAYLAFRKASSWPPPDQNGRL
ncbi:MAG TPA: hypothetical protein VFW19_05990 [Allosphingosinicella sp.]|nr:hypothetical protein [Allosphingosinicella sp.]